MKQQEITVSTWSLLAPSGVLGGAGLGGCERSDPGQYPIYPFPISLKLTNVTLKQSRY